MPLLHPCMGYREPRLLASSSSGADNAAAATLRSLLPSSGGGEDNNSVRRRRRRSPAREHILRERPKRKSPRRSMPRSHSNNNTTMVLSFGPGWRDKADAIVLISDPRVGVTATHESAAAAMCVRLVDVSGILAIHIPTRSLLRSSSTHEPSDPPLRVVLYILGLRRSVPTFNRLPPPLPRETCGKT